MSVDVDHLGFGVLVDEQGCAVSAPVCFDVGDFAVDEGGDEEALGARAVWEVEDEVGALVAAASASSAPVAEAIDDEDVFAVEGTVAGLDEVGEGAGHVAFEPLVGGLVNVFGKFFFGWCSFSGFVCFLGVGEGGGEREREREGQCKEGEDVGEPGAERAPGVCGRRHRRPLIASGT